MVRVRPLLVRFGFGRTTRSPLATVLVSYLLGVFGSYALGCGLSVLYTGACQLWTGSWQHSRVGDDLQAVSRVPLDGERMSVCWSATWCFDDIEVERTAEPHGRRFGDTAYPYLSVVDAGDLECRTNHSSNDRVALTPTGSAWADSVEGMWSELPSWAAHPVPGSDEVIVSSTGFGWPFRATLFKQVLLRDATTGRSESAPIWETRSDAVLNALAWRPIVPGLLADGVVCGGAVWLVWMALASAVRKRLVAGGKCAFCGYVLVACEGTERRRCPECGHVPPALVPEAASAEGYRTHMPLRSAALEFDATRPRRDGG